MTRRLGLIAILCLALIGSAGAAATTARPTLRLLGRNPVALRGIHFKPAEWVRVVLTTDGRHIRRVRATALGSFTVRFAGVSVADPCSGLFVQAIGGRGSRALLKVRPECLPA